MDAEVVLLAIAETEDEGTYSFACPGCQDVIRKPADHNVVALLLSAGVQVQRDAEGPAPERGEPDETAPSGSAVPPLTTDDLIEFHYLLERPDWFRLLLDTAAH